MQERATGVRASAVKREASNLGSLGKVFPVRDILERCRTRWKALQQVVLQDMKIFKSVI